MASFRGVDREKRGRGSPGLPSPSAVPFFLFGALLSRRFARAIAGGELDFLRDRILRVVLQPPGFAFDVTLREGQLRVAAPGGHAGGKCQHRGQRRGERWDLWITGGMRDFLRLATRLEDADTLFFQRRLKMEGDTELGLYLKNFLDAQEEAEQALTRFAEDKLRGAVMLLERFENGTRLSRR